MCRSGYFTTLLKTEKSPFAAKPCTYTKTPENTFVFTLAAIILSTGSAFRRTTCGTSGSHEERFDPEDNLVHKYMML